MTSHLVLFATAAVVVSATTSAPTASPSTHLPRGRAVAWGDSDYGGDLATVSSELTWGVTAVYSTDRAFAAVKSGGSVVTWGWSSYGGNSTTVSSALASNVTAVYSTD